MGNGGWGARAIVVAAGRRKPGIALTATGPRPLVVSLRLVILSSSVPVSLFALFDRAHGSVWRVSLPSSAAGSPSHALGLAQVAYLGCRPEAARGRPAFTRWSQRHGRRFA